VTTCRRRGLAHDARELAHRLGAVAGERGAVHGRERRRFEGGAPGREHLAVGERTRGPSGELVDAHHRADEAADRGRVQRDRQPLVQRTAFVGLEVAEPDPAQAGRIDQGGNGLAHGGEDGAHAGMEEQRLVVAHEELIEL
jgi:hypothetical protein